jgi:hypothetical protein
MFDNIRSDKRFTFITKCQLDINGAKFNCLVDNISTVGALIEVPSPDKKYIQVGRTGTLNVLLLTPVKYHCKVVRINSNQVGLQFFNLHDR